jgi:hypothetical protein
MSIVASRAGDIAAVTAKEMFNMSSSEVAQVASKAAADMVLRWHTCQLSNFVAGSGAFVECKTVIESQALQAGKNAGRKAGGSSKEIKLIKKMLRQRVTAKLQAKNSHISDQDHDGSDITDAKQGVGKEGDGQKDKEIAQTVVEGELEENSDMQDMGSKDGSGENSDVDKVSDPGYGSHEDGNANSGSDDDNDDNCSNDDDACYDESNDDADEDDHDDDENDDDDDVNDDSNDNDSNDDDDDDDDNIDDDSDNNDGGDDDKQCEVVLGQNIEGNSTTDENYLAGTPAIPHKSSYEQIDSERENETLITTALLVATLEDEAIAIQNDLIFAIRPTLRIRRDRGSSGSFSISGNGNVIHYIGTFDTEEMARAAYEAARDKKWSVLSQKMVASCTQLSKEGQPACIPIKAPTGRFGGVHPLEEQFIVQVCFGNSRESDFRKVFNALDRGGSGHVDVFESSQVDELDNAIMSELRCVVEMYKSDSNGQMNQDEFVDWMLSVSEGVVHSSGGPLYVQGRSESVHGKIAAWSSMIAESCQIMKQWEFYASSSDREVWCPMLQYNRRRMRVLADTTSARKMAAAAVVKAKTQLGVAMKYQSVQSKQSERTAEVAHVLCQVILHRSGLLLLEQPTSLEEERELTIRHESRIHRIQFGDCCPLSETDAALEAREAVECHFTEFPLGFEFCETKSGFVVTKVRSSKLAADGLTIGHYILSITNSTGNYSYTTFQSGTNNALLRVFLEQSAKPLSITFGCLKSESTRATEAEPPSSQLTGKSNERVEEEQIGGEVDAKERLNSEGGEDERVGQTAEASKQTAALVPKEATNNDQRRVESLQFNLKDIVQVRDRNHTGYAARWHDGVVTQLDPLMVEPLKIRGCSKTWDQIRPTGSRVMRSLTGMSKPTSTTNQNRTDFSSAFTVADDKKNTWTLIVPNDAQKLLWLRKIQARWKAFHCARTPPVARKKKIRAPAVLSSFSMLVPSKSQKIPSGSVLTEIDGEVVAGLPVDVVRRRYQALIDSKAISGAYQSAVLKFVRPSKDSLAGNDKALLSVSKTTQDILTDSANEYLPVSNNTDHSQFKDGAGASNDRPLGTANPIDASLNTQSGLRAVLASEEMIIEEQLPVGATSRLTGKARTSLYRVKAGKAAPSKSRRLLSNKIPGIVTTDQPLFQDARVPTSTSRPPTSNPLHTSVHQNTHSDLKATMSSEDIMLDQQNTAGVI